MAGHPPVNRTGALRLALPTACSGLLAIGLGLSLGLASGPGRSGGLTEARADGAVEALVDTAVRACRTALASRYAADPASLEIWLTPGLRIAIDSGELGSAAVRREGLQFGWMLNGRPAPAPIGLCRTREDGTVAAIEVQKD